MTEICGVTAILPPNIVQYGCVDLPFPTVEMKSSWTYLRLDTLRSTMHLRARFSSEAQRLLVATTSAMT